MATENNNHTSNAFNTALLKARKEYRKSADELHFSSDEATKKMARRVMKNLVDIFGLEAVNPLTFEFNVGDEVAVGDSSDTYYEIVERILTDPSPKYKVKAVEKSIPYGCYYDTTKTLVFYETDIYPAPKFKYGDIVSIKNKKLEEYLDISKSYTVIEYSHYWNKYILLGISDIVDIKENDLELVQSFPRGYGLNKKDNEQGQQ